MKQNNISFVIPAYNAEKYIARTINEILKVDNKEIECIVIDDGSTDETGAIVRENAKKDSRIRLIKKKNGGVSAARNTGLKYASGEFICFVDADDIIDSTFFSEISMDDLRKYEVCMYSYQEIYQNGTMKIMHADMRDNLLPRQLIDRLLDCQYSVQHAGNYMGGKVYQYLISRKFLNQNKIAFRPQMHFAEDMLFCIELFANGPEIICVDKVGYYYFVRPNTASHKYRKKYWAEHKEILKNVKEIQYEYKIYTEKDFRQVYSRLKLFYMKDVIAHNARYSFGHCMEVLRNTKEMLRDTNPTEVIAECNWDDWTHSEMLVNYLLTKKATIRLLLYYVGKLFCYKTRKRLKDV